MPKILGMEPRVALLVGGAVAVVAFLAWRARQGSAATQASLPALPDALPGAGEAAGAAGQSAQDAYAQQMQNLELAAAQQEQQFRTGQLKRQADLETAQMGLETAQAQGQASLLSQMYQFAQGKGKLPGAVQCPKGKVRFDPSTGQFYCREKQHSSVGQGLGRIGTGLGRFAQNNPQAVAMIANEPSQPAPRRGFGRKRR